MKNGLAHLLFLFEAHDRIRDSTATQLSLVVTLLVSAAGTWLAQLTVRLVGQVRLGGLVSWTGMGWAQVALLSHISVARQLRLVKKQLAQLLELIESPFPLTLTLPPQLSLVVTLLGSGGG